MVEKLGTYRMTFHASTELSSIEENRTKVIFKGDIRILGVGGSMVEKVIAGLVDDMTDEFTKNLNSRLATKAADLSFS